MLFILYMTNWKLCRACLSPEESFTYLLFQNVSAEQYTFCTSVEVHEHEDLPKALCISCHEVLTKFIQFKNMCIQSQNSLSELKCQKVKIEVDVSNSALYNNGFHDNDKLVKEEDFSGHFDDDLFEDHNLPNDDINDKTMKRDKKKLQKTKKKHKIKIVGTKKQRYSCELCTKTFVFFERFEAHKLEHEGKITPIHCLPCNKTFATWNGLKRHNINEHTVVKLESLKCKNCGKIFKSQDSLKLHVKMHENTPQMVHVCDVCGRKFRTKSILKSHLEIHKENRQRDYTCEHCGKKFFSKTVLMNHVSRRHTSRRYICHTCNYPFTQKYNLIKHLLIHEGKKLYTCDICQKSYGAQSTLTEHKRTHSGERPYPCTYCSKSFMSRRRLNDHHLTHTGERPHKCLECNLSFTQRGTLTRHMKVHEKTL